jgi:hypothetical protein
LGAHRNAPSLRLGESVRRQRDVYSTLSKNVSTRRLSSVAALSS